MDISTNVIAFPVLAKINQSAPLSVHRKLWAVFKEIPAGDRVSVLETLIAKDNPFDDENQKDCRLLQMAELLVRYQNDECKL